MSKPLVCKPGFLHNVNEQNIYKDSKFEVNPCTYDQGGHKGFGVGFKCCTFYEFPSANSIINHCPHILMLGVYNSKLSRITAKDLEGFEKLTHLYIDSCEIEHLPGDLFKHTPNLEIISFFRNKIKTVGDGLLTPLQSMRSFDLSLNTGIDYCFKTFPKWDIDYYFPKRGSSLEEFKTKLKEIEGTNSELCTDLEAKLEISD